MSESSLNEIEMECLRLLARRWESGLFPFSASTTMRELGLRDRGEYIRLMSTMRERGLIYTVMWGDEGPSFIGPTPAAHDLFMSLEGQSQR